MGFWPNGRHQACSSLTHVYWQGVGRVADECALRSPTRTKSVSPTPWSDSSRRCVKANLPTTRRILITSLGTRQRVWQSFHNHAPISSKHRFVFTTVVLWLEGLSYHLGRDQRLTIFVGTRGLLWYKRYWPYHRLVLNPDWRRPLTQGQSYKESNLS